MKTLQHKNIVQIYEVSVIYFQFYQFKNYLIIEMEYCEKGSLYQILKNGKLKENSC